MHASVSIILSLLHAATAADGVPGDVKYIKCEVCEKLVTSLHSHLAKQGKLSSEAAAMAAIETACQADAAAGAWMRFIDLVEDTEHRRLHLVDQDKDGPCEKECRTIALACSAVLEEGWENELGEALFNGDSAASLRGSACREWSSACRKPPPKLDLARPTGPAFRAYTEEERALQDSGKSPPPGVLSEPALRRRLAVDVGGAHERDTADGSFDQMQGGAAPSGSGYTELEHTAAYGESVWPS